MLRTPSYTPEDDRSIAARRKNPVTERYRLTSGERCDSAGPEQAVEARLQLAQGTRQLAVAAVGLGTQQVQFVRQVVVFY